MISHVAPCYNDCLLHAIATAARDLRIVMITMLIVLLSHLEMDSERMQVWVLLYFSETE